MTPHVFHYISLQTTHSSTLDISFLPLCSCLNADTIRQRLWRATGIASDLRTARTAHAVLAPHDDSHRQRSSSGGVGVIAAEKHQDQGMDASSAKSDARSVESTMLDSIDKRVVSDTISDPSTDSPHNPSFKEDADPFLPRQPNNPHCACTLCRWPVPQYDSTGARTLPREVKDDILILDGTTRQPVSVPPLHSMCCECIDANSCNASIASNTSTTSNSLDTLHPPTAPETSATSLTPRPHRVLAHSAVFAAGRPQSVEQWQMLLLAVARELRARVHWHTGLTCSVGIASTR